MRALVQRVERASVSVEEKITGEIGAGLLVLLGIKNDDLESSIDWLVNKCCNLRVFEDADGKMNKSVSDIDGEILVVSQFTLYGDSRKGNRPSFNAAAAPEMAEKFYETFVTKLSLVLGKPIPTGVFGAHMKVDLLNDGPVTILLEKD